MVRCERSLVTVVMSQMARHQTPISASGTGSAPSPEPPFASCERLGFRTEAYAEPMAFAVKKGIGRVGSNGAECPETRLTVPFPPGPVR